MGGHVCVGHSEKGRLPDGVLAGAHAAQAAGGRSVTEPSESTGGCAANLLQFVTRQPVKGHLCVLTRSCPAGRIT